MNDGKDEVVQLYLDDSVDIIISEAGGEVEYELLEFLDFDKMLKATPKYPKYWGAL
mgnify:CR=1 FL=1